MMIFRFPSSVHVCVRVSVTCALWVGSVGREFINPGIYDPTNGRFSFTFFSLSLSLSFILVRSLVLTLPLRERE